MFVGEIPPDGVFATADTFQWAITVMFVDVTRYGNHNDF